MGRLTCATFRTICGLRQIMILEDLYAEEIEPLMPKGATISPVVTPSAPAGWGMPLKRGARTNCQ